MYQPYKLIVVNLTLSIVIIAGILIYKVFFPKKKVPLFFLLLVISLLPVVSVLRVGVYESGDFNLHIYRAMDFYRSLQDGIMMPSWAAYLNATYGYPLFIFLDPLPYYIIALFHFIGFTFIMSMKLFLICSYILSGIFMYLWVRFITKNSFAVFCASIMYLFTPYHLIDLHYRVAVGEILFFALFPLLFYFLDILIDTLQHKYFLLTAITFAFAMFAHQAMAVFGMLVLIPYIIYRILLKKDHKRPISGTVVSALLLGMLLSAYSWYPHVAYTKYTYAHLLSSSLILFPHLTDLLFSPWRFGFLFQGPKGQLSFLIGYAQLLTTTIAAIVLFLNRKRIKKMKELLFFFCIWFLIFFMMTSLSAIFWKIIPILNTAQFAYRLLLPMTFVTSAMVGYLVFYTKNYKGWYGVLILITIGSTLLNWGNRRVIPAIADDALQRGLPYSTINGEAFCCMGSPKWVDITHPWQGTIPSYSIEIIQGKGTIKQILRTPTEHEYVADAKTQLYVKENTYYFPGWNVIIDKQNTLIREDTKDPGVIHFIIPKGLHNIHVVYHDLPDLIFLKRVTIIGLLSIAIYLLFSSLMKLAIHRLF